MSRYKLIFEFECSVEDYSVAQNEAHQIAIALTELGLCEGEIVYSVEEV